MKYRRKHDFGLSFTDMLYAMMAVYAFLFLVAYALIKPADQKPGIEMKAEYVLMMTWPDGSLDDIDLHLLLPDNQMVNFRTREVEFAFLDHDDIGVSGMYVGTDGKPLKVPEHKEMITLRAIVPGTYAVNVHVYRVNEEYASFKSTATLPYPVKVMLYKLNPRMEEIASATVTLSVLGEQKTAFAFTIKQDGSVSVDPEADVPFIPTIPQFPVTRDGG